MKNAACPSRWLPTLLSVSFIAGTAFSSTIVVLQRDKRFELISVDQIQINGKDRIRIGAASPSYTSRQVSQYPAQRLSQLPVIQFDLTLGVFRVPSQGNSAIALPDSDKLDGTAIEMWTRAVIGINKGGGKQFDPLPTGKVWAILQGASSTDVLAAYIADAKNFQHPAGSSETLRLQGEMIAASLASFPNSDVIAAVRISSEKSFRASLDKLDSGLAELADLNEAREKGKLSALVFPADSAQNILRSRLEHTESKLKEMQAILRAFEIASMWDAFVAKYRSFQRYEFIYPEYQETFRKALAASRDEHKRLALDRQQLKDCAASLAHYRIALRRDPADLLAREQAEASRVCLVRSPRANRASKKTSSDSELAPATRTNEFVIRFLQEAKLESAEKALNQGIQLYPDFPPLLLSKARWLERRNQLRTALAVLDRYDSLVSTQEEWNEGDKARRDIEFQILKSRDERGKKLLTQINEYRFATALAQVQEGLAADEEDQELLFRGGILKIILRDPSAARTFFQKYLEASQSLSGNPARRKQAFGLLSSLDAAPLESSSAAEKRPNWLSKNSLASALYYDPVSLAFHRRIERVELSQKQGIEFAWTGDNLDSIQIIAEEKPPRTLAKFRFDYLVAGSAVRRLSDTTAKTAPVARVDTPGTRQNMLFDDPVAQASSGATSVGPGPSSAANLPADLADFFSESGFPVLLANHPYVDIAAVERLTGLQLGRTVTGNRFFHPFVWDKPVSFRLSYDDQGRAIRAYSVAPGEVPEVHVFTWDGPRLTEISIHPILPNAQPDRSKILYRRALIYADGLLTSERVDNPTGKPVRIEYKYQNGALVSVEGEADPSLGNKSFKAKISSR